MWSFESTSRQFGVAGLVAELNLTDLILKVSHILVILIFFVTEVEIVFDINYQN